MQSLPRRGFLAAFGAAPLLSAAELDMRPWMARWIFPVGIEPEGYGVYHFRRTFTLDAAPASFPVKVTADSRYHLFINGTKVATGPARGDPHHWRYETVDITPHLRPGKNVLASVVWNDGPHAAVAQWSVRTGFLLQAGESAHEALVNTGPEWVCTVNRAYQAVPVPMYQPTGYYAIGACERLDASQYPWGWEKPEFDDSGWQKPEVYRNGAPRDSRDASTRWMLVPRPIPPMEETPQASPKVRRADNAPASIPANIPAGTKARFLLDQGFETCGFPEVKVTGGRGARVALKYAEAMWLTEGSRRVKGNRTEIEGKEFTGYGDEFLCDGQARTWRTLFWRTWRYLELTVETAGEPLVLESLASIYTGYPFARLATLDSGVAEHQQMLDVGWRTARLCAHETYMDCPYYEQLQYVGDTRIQALVSLYNSGDARLMRNAIELIDDSRTPEGATYSRSPSVLQQYIPPFSLWWVGMVHDYWQYVDDPAFVKQMLAGVRGVLGWYASFLKQDGALGPMPWWNYVDWVEAWRSGRPPSEADLMPASIHLQLLLAFQWAADLDEAHAEAWKKQAEQMAGVIRRAFWDESKQLFSEDRAHQHLSQHANVLAILAGLVKGEPAQALMRRIDGNRDLYQCSVYFRYYFNRALVESGLGDLYLERLQIWQDMLKDGLTTWAEKDGPNSRSDCHAWGASPNIELFRTVLGVDADAPGFRKIVIRPHLGPLTRVRGTVPHPRGTITVELTQVNGQRRYKVTKPQGVEARIEWGPVRAPISG